MALPGEPVPPPGFHRAPGPEPADLPHHAGSPGADSCDGSARMLIGVIDSDPRPPPLGGSLPARQKARESFLYQNVLCTYLGIHGISR